MPDAASDIALLKLVEIYTYLIAINHLDFNTPSFTQKIFHSNIYIRSYQIITRYENL